MTSAQVQHTEWTAEQFMKMALEGPPRVAVFDCDGTIWGGDSGTGFMRWSMDQGLVSRSTSDWIDTRYRAYLAGHVSELAICGEMVQMYAGLHDAELRSAAARFVEQKVRPNIFPEIAALIAALNEAGTEIWAVSSTNKWIVSEGVRALGIPCERVLSAEVAVRDGVATPDLVDVPTDEGKAASLHRAGVQTPDAVFGNSIHDLAMLEIAARPFPVNPSPGLLTAADKRGWGFFRPQGADGHTAHVGGE